MIRQMTRREAFRMWADAVIHHYHIRPTREKYPHPYHFNMMVAVWRENKPRLRNYMERAR